MRIFISIHRMSFGKISVVALLAGLLCVPALPAQADQTGVGSNPSGYTAMVRIHFYGTGIPGGSIHKEVPVHPSCWWAPAAGPYTDAVAMLAWYDQVTAGLDTRGVDDLYGPRKVWQAEAKAEQNGTADISWYRAYCDNPADYTKFGVDSVETDYPVLGSPTNFVTYLYHPFNAGEAIPPPRVSAEELARAARREMVIPEPETGRNPMIDSPGAPTLVGLPTWFWVTNPLAVGGNAGELDVTAELNQADGRVWAEVVARTGGLSITSDYGSTGSPCSPTRAQVKYPKDSATPPPDEAACTVVFRRAALALPITVSTAWGASWTGSGQAAPIGLEGLTQFVNTTVPVAEVQNIVTR